jgi:hypothetical protein
VGDVAYVTQDMWDAAEAELKDLRARRHQLYLALKHYEHCRHACQDCFCTKEARAALNGEAQP